MERLIDYFKPAQYQLKLRIDKVTEQVAGTEVIQGELVSGDTVKLHAENMTIRRVLAGGRELVFVHENNILNIPARSGQPLNFTIEFSYQLKRNMEGAYLSTYDLEGKEERIVATQFESHYAREAFPCVDEPEAKAIFALEITTPHSQDTILSNMPVAATHTKAGVKTVRFEPTPRMSTYLLAFVLGRFNKVSTRSTHGVEVTTYAALNQSKTSLKFSNQIAAETLDLYDDLFGTPYPLPKLDQVALPDFEAGAMENWGLVTFREACLLAEPNASQSHKEYVATVVTHELSHQWFGNLVTMKWWDDLWLNESFANMMQFYSVDQLHPDWHIWHDFFTEDCYYALRRDALPGVQAVQQPVNDPAEIAALFDGAIVYAKGSHLMFMLMRLMGESAFFAGLKQYFKQHQYQNTTGDDLWAALQPHADFDIKEFMHAWITQPGYPMLTDGAQQRFLLSGNTDQTKWPLPAITDDMSGHYVICLSGMEFDDKIKQFATLSLEQKLRLLIDRELLSKTPLVSAASLIDLLPEFKHETSAPVFSLVANIVNSLKIFCAPDTPYYSLYRRFVYNIVAPSLERLGYEPAAHEDDNDTKLRAYCLGFAIYARNLETLQMLSDIYDRDVTRDHGHCNYSRLNSEIRGAVMDAKFCHSEEAVFDQYLKDYQKIADPSIKSTLLAAITSAEQPEHIDTLIQLLESPDIVRPQDHIYLFSYLLGNYYTRARAYDWFYEHWDYIKQLTSDKSMDDYVRVAAGRINSSAESDRYFAFFDPKQTDPGIARSIEVARTDIASRLRWLAEDSEAVRARLERVTQP